MAMLGVASVETSTQVITQLHKQAKLYCEKRGSNTKMVTLIFSLTEFFC